jgi:hypothetical protein
MCVQWEVVSGVLNILYKQLHACMCILLIKWHLVCVQWEVVSGVLSILYKLLQEHEVKEEDFRDELLELPDGSVIASSRPPGLNILFMMLNDSPLFKMVCAVRFILFK